MRPRVSRLCMVKPQQPYKDHISASSLRELIVRPLRNFGPSLFAISFDFGMS